MILMMMTMTMMMKRMIAVSDAFLPKYYYYHLQYYQLYDDH